jgi:hypothetical protein
VEENHSGLERLIAYREGTLSAAERESVQEHLSLCPSCTRLLLELRDFEADTAAGDAGPESLRQEAWDSLARRLPQKPPVVRPISGAPRPTAPPPPRRVRTLTAAAAALLFAVLAFSLWRQMALEQQLEKRNAQLASLQRSLEESERRLLATQSRIQGVRESPAPADPKAPDRRVDALEARIAELTAEVESLRRNMQSPERPERIAVASRSIEVSVAPRFVLRGQEPAGGLLRGNGEINPVQPEEPAGRFTVALDLIDSPAHDEYRLELIDREDRVLWTTRRPGAELLGDAGITVSIAGLGPGRYRLRIEGLLPRRSRRLAEYLLEVQQTETP